MTVSIRNTNARIVSLINIPRWLPTPDNVEANRAQKVIRDAVIGFIEERRKSGEDKGDLLSMLLLATDEETGHGMSDKQVYHEAITLFAAGHETTANALTWSWLLLGRNPAAMQKLQAELDEQLQGRTPTMQDLVRLPYTEQVIKESMRLYPPAWIMNRQAIEDMNIGGYDVPKGSLIFFSQYAMHRHPKYYAEPDAFMPERWTVEFEKQLPKYAYFPFGGGPRVCIGQQFAMMEARLILASIAQRWTMEIVPEQVIEEEPLITLRARNGIKVRLHAR
jgi:cytochrome P450